jgi:ATP-dependent DNA ligase
MPPVPPMLAKSVSGLPTADGYLFEPKFDGFRALVFRDGEEVELLSRNERPLTRYFPELPGPLAAQLPERCVVDGEIVVAGPNGLDFDLLGQRIHPAASRIRRLAEETPATFIAFDVLALGSEDLRERTQRERRTLIEDLLRAATWPLLLAPATTDRATAADWFTRFEGAGLDGVIAKPLDLPYRPGERVMLKIKHERTADCVVAGFRWHKEGDTVGSLLLGLYDDGGTLHSVGVATGFSTAQRRELVDEIAPLRVDALDGHPWSGWAEPDATTGRMPGGPSRWTGTRDLSWEALRPERVVEVGYTQLVSGRFRHATRFLRWRPDRTPDSCRYDQLEAPAPAELMALFR